MNTPIIDTKCSSCRRPYRGRGEWDLVILSNKLVGATCPRCAETKTPDRDLSAAARMANVVGSPSVDKEIGVRHLSPLVHLLSQPGRGLMLKLDRAEISTPHQATELGHTLLLLGQLMMPAARSAPYDPQGGFNGSL